jgi:ribosomal-protein-alanine N-acetyltransferase
MSQPQGFSILSAGWRDLAELRRLEQVSFEQDAWPLFDLIGVLTFTGMVRLKAVDTEGKMLGFIAGDIRDSTGIGWIITVAVFPEYRRIGVGRALLQECEQRMGVQRVRLSVRRSNRAAIELYEARGYHLVDVWNGYYSGGEDALVLEKKLLGFS